MLTRIMKPRDDRDAGFTLIELLVVVVIIGILAAIAIPVFLNQRNAARNASVESDIRNLATVMETYYTQNDAYPSGVTAAADLEAAGAGLSAGNAVAITYPAAGQYVMIGCNEESLEVYKYDSGGGGFVTPAGGDACPAVGSAITFP